MFSLTLAKGFSRGIQATNYYFWLCGLEPTMAETAENKELGPSDGCKNFDLKSLQFSYPLAPDNRVLNGVSMEVSGIPNNLWTAFTDYNRSTAAISLPSSVLRVAARAR